MTLVAFAALGLGAGLMYFGALRWISLKLAALPANASAWATLGVVQALRLLLLSAVLVWAARQGTWPLGVLAAGVLGARVAWVAAVRHAGRSGA